MVGMECLQLRTINLQAFKRTKPCAEEPVGCWRRLGHSLLEGGSWGQGEIELCTQQRLPEWKGGVSGSIRSWDWDFSTSVQM